MTDEIKNILDYFKRSDKNKFGFEQGKLIDYEEAQLLLDYITNLQQDLDKANDIIEKDRQFYKCRMDEYAELKKENESNINRIHELEQEIDSEYVQKENYKSRCKKAIELYKNCKEEDYCILSLNMYEVLNGSDENE